MDNSGFNSIDSDLIRGHIDTIILRALFKGDRYGYDIIKEIESRSGGEYKLKQSTLYSCLKRLEQQGFIHSYWGNISSGSRRRYYSLTSLGREVFLKNQTEWEKSKSIINSLITDNDFTENYKFIETPSLVVGEPFFNESINKDNEMEIQEDLEPESQNENFEFETPIETPSSNIPDIPAYNPNYAQSNQEKQEYLDTAKIMKTLLNEEYDKSYFATLKQQDYNPTPIAFKPSYQMDLEQDDLESEQLYSQTEQASEQTIEPQSVSNKVSDEIDSDSQNIIADSETDSIEELNESQVQKNIDFLKYNVKAFSQNNSDIIDREYKKILENLVEDAALANSANLKQEQASAANDDFFVNNTKYQIRKFQDLSDSIRGLGNDIKIRKHNNDGKLYNNVFYYYSNKIMLKHFIILFALMLCETALSFLLVWVGLKINQTYDWLLYVGAVLLALSFPAIAFACNITNPEKIKRFNFDLKSSVIVGLILMLGMFIIIYLLNVCFKMPVTFSMDYLSSLLLPMLLATNIPVSSLIFHCLYRTKKYSAD